MSDWRCLLGIHRWVRDGEPRSQNHLSTAGVDVIRWVYQDYACELCGSGKVVSFPAEVVRSPLHSPVP